MWKLDECENSLENLLPALYCFVLILYVLNIDQFMMCAGSYVKLSNREFISCELTVIGDIAPAVEIKGDL